MVNFVIPTSPLSCRSSDFTDVNVLTAPVIVAKQGLLDKFLQRDTTHPYCIPQTSSNLLKPRCSGIFYSPQRVMCSVQICMWVCVFLCEKEGHEMSCRLTVFLNVVVMTKFMSPHRDRMMTQGFGSDYFQIG